MRKWGLGLVLGLTIFAVACNEKKEGNAFLFILSFDPLEYFDIDSSSSGLTVDPSGVITLAGTGQVPVDGPIANPPTPGGRLATVATNLLPDDLDTETVVDLSDNTREAFVSVAQQNVESCAGMGAFASVTCSLSGFAIDIGDALKAATSLVSIQISGANVDGDGVASNTLYGKRYSVRRVSATNPAGTTGDRVGGPMTFSDKLYFTTNTTDANSTLVVYDGTTLKQVLNNVVTVSPYAGAQLGTNLIVQAAPNGGPSANQLYVYNGTTGARLLSTAAGTAETIAGSAVFEDDLYMSILIGAGNYDIYSYDGTNVYRYTNDSSHEFILGQTTKGVFYYAATQKAIYLLDPGASEKNTRVTSTAIDFPGLTGAPVSFVINDTLCFNGETDSSSQVGIFCVKDAEVIRQSNFTFSDVSVYNDIAYGISGTDLYKFDGTTFERLNPTAIQISSNPGPTQVLATSDGVYFTNRSAANGNEFYRYRQRRFEKLFNFKDLPPTGQNTTANNLFEHGGEVYFTANGGTLTPPSESLYKIELRD